MLTFDKVLSRKFGNGGAGIEEPIFDQPYFDWVLYEQIIQNWDLANL